MVYSDSQVKEMVNSYLEELASWDNWYLSHTERKEFGEIRIDKDGNEYKIAECYLSDGEIEQFAILSNGSFPDVGENDILILAGRDSEGFLLSLYEALGELLEYITKPSNGEV